MFIFPLILGGAIILGASVATIKQLNKKKANKLWVGFTLVIAIGLFAGLYHVAYRPYGLYENHFREAVGEFPENATYTFADTWVGSNESPAMSSVALIKLDGKEYQNLKTTLIQKGYDSDSLGLRRRKYTGEQIDYALQFGQGLNIIDGYLVEQQIDVPADLEERVMRFKKAKMKQPEELIALKNRLEQDFVQLDELDGKLVGASFVKYYVAFLSDGKSIVLYVLHE